MGLIGTITHRMRDRRPQQPLGRAGPAPAAGAAIPSAFPSATLVGLLGPLSFLALVAVGVAFGALIVGMVAENRDGRAIAATAQTGTVVRFPGRGRSDRAAA